MAKGKNKKQASRPAGKSGGQGGISGFQIGLIVAAIVIIAGGAGAGILLSTRKDSGDSSATGGIKLPDFVYKNTAPAGAVTAYQFALDDPADLKQIPCYCGCGQIDGHTSNLDCFIKARDGNDVTFDQHGAG